ncbi:hypothetical protein DPMN_173385 [Dreissena polymorpha]|uniref:Uncharacterized protein n=1 Tax=Dreissena polymorpha TaxID=45954 RepID=A0A9D4IHI8_DREPO|nr:hypothetical protein DPMN_173385 [Dreissena polymorpha]
MYGELAAGVRAGNPGCLAKKRCLVIGCVVCFKDFKSLSNVSPNSCVAEGTFLQTA